MGLIITTVAEQNERRQKEVDHQSLHDFIKRIIDTKVELAVVNAEILAAETAITNVGDAAKQTALQDTTVIATSLADYQRQKTRLENRLATARSKIAALHARITSVNSPYDMNEKKEFTDAKRDETLVHLS